MMTNEVTVEPIKLKNRVLRILQPVCRKKIGQDGKDVIGSKASMEDGVSQCSQQP